MMTSNEVILHETRIAARMATLARTVAVAVSTQHAILDEICAKAHEIIDEYASRRPERP